VLRAHSPFWRQVGLNEFGQVSFVSLAEDRQLVMVNRGDVDAWPEWTMTGYATAIEVSNLTTGKVWRITRILDFGDTLHVATDPVSFGVSLNGQLGFSVAGEPIADPVSEWWPLVPGDNHVFIRAVTQQSGLISAQWAHRWDTP
jgi:hypothetical protein